MSRDIPRYRSRSERFDAAVLDAYAPLAHNFRNELANVDVAVDMIPRMRLQATTTILPDEVCADGAVPLGRVIPAGVDDQGTPTRPRIVVFRQPIEQRCVSSQERSELLRRVLTSLVATYLNVLPTDIDPTYEM